MGEKERGRERYSGERVIKIEWEQKKEREIGGERDIKRGEKGREGKKKERGREI